MKRELNILWVSVVIICMTAVFNMSSASADPISDAKERPINLKERQFIERVTAELRKHFPSPGDGWEMEEKVSIGQNIYRGEKGETLIYESMGKVTLPINIRLDHYQMTKEENINMRKEAQHAADMGTLQEEMMKAIQTGDHKEVERISQKMAALQEGDYIDRMSPMVNPQEGKREKKKAKNFYVQVLVNRGGEVVGKKYESFASGATKAFVVKKKKSSDKTSYKYYFGPWKVKERDGNWSITFPDNMDTAANHLRVITLVVAINGDSAVVDDYVKKHVRTNSLSAIAQ